MLLEKGRDLITARAGLAPTKRGTFERRCGMGKSDGFGFALAFRKCKGKCAMPDVTRAQSVDDGYVKSGRPSALCI